MSKRLRSAVTVGSTLSATLLYIVACGGSSTPKKVDAKIVDTKTVDVAVTCAANSTYPAKTYGSGSATDNVAINHGSGGSNYSDNLQWQGLVQSSPEQFLDLEAYSGGGSGSGGTPDWPSGNVTPKSNIDLATAPDAYIILGANVDSSGTAQDIYLSIAGTLNITSTTTNFAGSVSGLMVQHVDITSGGISADPDGCMASFGNFSFNHTISQMAAGPSDNRGVQLHTTSLLHE